MTQANYGNDTTHWYQFKEALTSRTVKPLRHPTFFFYFLFGVLIFGGFGVWVEIGRATLQPDSEANFKSVCFAINVFYPSLGCASMLQFAVGNYPKMLRALGILLAVIFVIACTIIALLPKANGWVLLAEITLSLLACWTWWIANAENPDFLEPSTPTAYGPTDTETPLAGSLKDFKVN